MNEKPKTFETGKLVATAAIARAMNGMTEENILFAKFIEESFGRHISCDWGDIDAEDIEVNNDALEHGGRLLSAYIPKQYPQLDNDEYKIWIITEADRRSTTLLFPSEY